MTQSPFMSSAHEAAFSHIEAEWRALEQSSLETWEADFATMDTEQRTLVSQGRWIGGPSDMLTIIGRARREVFHSAMLAWLLDPNGRHRLGVGLLRALVDACDIAWTVDDASLAACTSATEISAEQSRADIVVSGPDLHLVIEVKVDAAEGERQCQRLFDDHDRPEACFVFLTPSGRPPQSCDADTIRSAWTPISFRWVATTLTCILDSPSRHQAADTAMATLQSYRATLDKEFR